MKRFLTTLLLVVAAVGFALAQRTVVGTVTGDGEALVGASVSVKGAAAGTRTDINGKYSLNVPAGSSVLVYTYTGFETQEITLGASNVVDVVMAGNAVVKEVVVTAIGIQRDKKAIGYSATDIRSDQMTQKAEVDPVRALTGKVAGVNITAGGGAPGQSTKINIRGNSSLTGNTQPLFVVDGVPFDNSVNASTSAASGSQYSNRAFDIDPNNIESLTVLKGAAAAALYGSRATNGVIVITTKTGKTKPRKGMELTFTQNNTWEQVSGLPEYQTKYGQGSNQLYNGGFIGNWGAPFAEYVDELNGRYGTSYSKTIERYPDGKPYPDGYVKHPLVGIPFTENNGYRSLFPELLDANGQPVPVKYQPYDFLGDFFDTGFLNESALSMNTGTEKTSLSATLSRMTNSGIVPESKSGRTNISVGGRAQLNNGLVVSGNVNYVNTTQANPPMGGSLFGGNFGTAEGSIFTRLYFLPRNYNLLEYPFENPVNGNNAFYRALDNPLWLIKNSRYTSDVNRAYGNLALSYDLTKWLNLTARGGMNAYTDDRNNYTRPGGDSDPNGEVWNNKIKNQEIDMNFLATAKTGIGENFDLTIVGGLNLNERKYSSLFILGDDVISPGTYTLGGTASQLVSSFGDYRELQRLYGVFGDIQMAFKDYWFVGITGRNDWASTLPLNDNSFFYPSVNTALVFTDALDIRSNILSYGKIRAAWSQVGNQADVYRTATAYRILTPFTTAGGNVVKQAPLFNRLGNAKLRNELTTEIEFGTDLRFFRNRLGIDFTWFKRNSTDQITEAALPGSSGFTSAIVNAGEIENKGIELGVNIDVLKSDRRLNWNSNFNLTAIKTLVVSAGDGGDIFVGGFSSALGVIHRTGQPYGQIYGTAIAKTKEGNYLIDKTQGLTIVTSESQIIGDPNPDFILGWNNTFSWRGISLSALIDWRQGGDMYLTTGGSLLARGQLKSTEDREPLRIIPGVYGDVGTEEPIRDENGNYIRNTVPVTAFDYYFSNGFGPYGADETNVFDATVIRLREVALGYSIPESWLKKTALGSARISVSGRNLWFRAPNFPEGLNMDPEVLGETAESNVQGFEYGSAPSTRRIGVNFSVTF
ncbi:MAG TPA: SusC/RagA family TonB-linked outer membrane protein [Saprospiraceae bacterium]|nr:SusC/RagA family TonB-linked outer membrane protein [Saprospiraceae bacterium]